MPDTSELISLFEKNTNSFCISVIYGQKRPIEIFGTRIAFDILPILYDILEGKNREISKISLIIRSNGGNIDTPLPFINLLREYCQELDIYIPENAHSAATLIALGGDRIFMTPFSSLSPIDPQINIPSDDKEKKVNISFSVEDIGGYYDLIQKKLKIRRKETIQALKYITQTINPTTLGQIERVRDLIHIYADRIIGKKIKFFTKRALIKSLIEEIPSHNYRICRKEAKKLGFPIYEPTEKQTEILQSLMKEYKKEFNEGEPELLVDFPEGSASLAKEYSRAVIETVASRYPYISNYVFHKNGKIDTISNKWRKMK